MVTESRCVISNERRKLVEVSSNKMLRGLVVVVDACVKGEPTRIGPSSRVYRAYLRDIGSPETAVIYAEARFVPEEGRQLDSNFEVELRGIVLDDKKPMPTINVIDYKILSRPAGSPSMATGQAGAKTIR